MNDRKEQGYKLLFVLFLGGGMLCKRLIEINLHFCHLLCLGLFYKIFKTEQHSENYKFWSIEKDISRSYHYFISIYKCPQYHFCNFKAMETV